MKLFNRRQLLSTAGLAAMAGVASNWPVKAQDNSKSPIGMLLIDVKDFGAVGDGKRLNTSAINQAINVCSSKGGGIVYFPPGVYLSGTAVLKSNVTLHFEAGATLLGSQNISDYALQTQLTKTNESRKPSVFENDLRDTGARHLIFAQDAENITIMGSGRIDGQGSTFWQPSGRTQPQLEDAWKDVIAFDWKPHLPRPSPMLEFYNCKNLHIREVQIENAAGWTLRTINCERVFIRGVSIKNPIYGPNTDGIDLTCCKNVFISDCLIDTGDDAICLKSENPYGDSLQTSKNITITNCVLSGCCNGFKAGTATHGGYENIIFSNSVIFNDDVPLNSRIIAGIALEMVDGGWIDGIIISNIRMQRARTPIFIRLGMRTPRPDGTPGYLRSITISDIQASGSILTSSITGIETFDVEDVTLSNIRIDSDENGQANWVTRKVPEMPESYPESREFGKLPAYGFYCRHVKGLRLRNVEFKAGAVEQRPAVFCDDVKDLELSGLRTSPIFSEQPIIKLLQVKHAYIRDCLAPFHTKVFLDVEGSQTEQITLMGNCLNLAEKALQISQGASDKAVTTNGNTGG